MSSFTLQQEKLDLPKGAFARGYRRMLWREGVPILGFTQGPFRAYLYPVYTPRGLAVTTESPADHPHHNSVWVAADHVHALRPLAGGRHEEATYCFYVNEVFQGRAPGSIVEQQCDGSEHSSTHYRVVQRLAWQGPSEWGAPSGQLIAEETRTIDVRADGDSHVVDIQSRLSPTEWDIRLGPTRHAYFGVRVAESMREISGGTLVSADGKTGGQNVSGTVSDWIDYSGPAGAGHYAGIAIFPGQGATGGAWFATDWGTVAINPFERKGRIVRQGERLELTLRLMVHDGDMRSAGVAGAYEAFAAESENISREQNG